MSKISIIVPVYNVERYLSKCVDSILNQTFTDFELILIDDGSTDNSGKICDEYSEKDERIKVIHKENEGLSSARNAGIDIAVGKCLGFVDSDDYIEKDMYEILYRDICQDGVDIAICGFYNQYKDKCYEDKYILEKCVLDAEEAFKLALMSRGISLSAVNKLYRKEIFKGKKFPLGKTYEDAFLVPELIISSNKISYNPVAKYYYVHRANSITTNEFRPSDFSHPIEAYKKHLEFVRKEYPHLENEALFRYIWSYMLVFDKMSLADNHVEEKTYKHVLNKIRQNMLFILRSPLFTPKRKLSAIMLFFVPSIYGKILKKYHQKNFDIIK